jgi:fatty-acyl-CoA synthase
VTDGSGVDEAVVVKHCEKLLADYKIPRYVVLRPDPLPRLPSGKLDKTAIRTEYRDVAERFARAR